MYLSKLFHQLGTGEIASYFLGSELAAGNIGKKYWPEIINHVNIGLTCLHTEFPLQEKELILQQYDHITKYRLTSEYAETNTASKVKYKYIKDSRFEPFQDDVLRIERVYDECYRDGYPLNDRTACDSLYTPGFNVLQVPTPCAHRTLFVIYRADHVEIPIDISDPSKVLVDIPRSLEEALLTYVAHRYLSSKNTEIASNLAARMYAKYVSICQKIDEKDLILQSHGDINTHPQIQGWV